MLPLPFRERPRVVLRGGELGEPALQHHAARDHRPGPPRPLLPQRIKSAHLHVSYSAAGHSSISSKSSRGVLDVPNIL